MIVALKSRNSAGNVLCRRLAEGGDPHVAETGLEALGEHAVHLDLLAAQRELEELGAPVAADGQLHHAAGSPAHAGDRARCAGEPSIGLRIFTIPPPATTSMPTPG